MTVRPLTRERAAELRAAPLTYTRARVPDDPPPPGYRHFEATVRLARTDFHQAARDLLSWRVQDRAGLEVHASDRLAKVGSVVEMRLGAGPVAVRIPCRVVEVVDEADRKGFAYATLPGHPETGEEWFVLDRAPDGSIRFTVAAFSRHASLLARLGGPVGRMVQDRMTQRYLAALDRL